MLDNGLVTSKEASQSSFISQQSKKTTKKKSRIPYSIESRGDLMTSRADYNSPLEKKNNEDSRFQGKILVPKIIFNCLHPVIFLQLHTKNTLNLLLVIMRYMCQGRSTPYIGDGHPTVLLVYIGPRLLGC